jgi:hypothetical protein
MSADSEEVVMIPQFDMSDTFVEIRDLARPNVRYQQGDNYFNRSKKFVEKAPYAVHVASKKAVQKDEPQQVKVRDRAAGPNGKSVVKMLSVDQLRQQAGTKAAKAKKAESLPEAVLKARSENRRVRAAEEAAAQ